MALTIKEVPGHKVDQPTRATVYALFDGNKMFFKKSRSGRMTPQWATTPEKARAKLERAKKASTSKKTSSASKPKRKKKSTSKARTSSASKPSVAECRRVLEAAGYSVMEPEVPEPDEELAAQWEALAERNNPRRR